MAQTNLNDDQIHTGEVGAVGVASGTTAQRPSSPTVGMIRYNTTESKLEGYDGQWKSFESFDPSSQTASNSLPTNTDTTTKVKLNLISEYYGTDFTQLPVGTTSQRPSTSSGSMRYNTTTSKFEGWNGSQWLEFSFISPPYEADILVQAGGGGSGGRRSSGAGAGGLITSYSSNRTISAVDKITLNIGTVYGITVGAGGTAAPAGNPVEGGKGGDSFISGIGLTTITANGGGAGGSMSQTTGTTQDGGCGAGGTAASACDSPAAKGSGNSLQGFDGGYGSKLHNGGGGGGGGGGGTKAVGTNGTGCVNNSYGGGSKAGGTGTASSITGSSVTYGTGGTAINGYSGSPTAGSANTGDGADGDQESGNSRAGVSGGSGVVILRVPTDSYSGTTTGSPTVSTDGTDTIIKFTSSGTYTA